MDEPLSNLLGQLQTLQLNPTSPLHDTLNLLDRVLSRISQCQTNTFLSVELDESQAEAEKTLKQSTQFLSKTLKSVLKGEVECDDPDSLTDRLSLSLSRIGRMSGDAEGEKGEGASIRWVFDSDLQLSVKELSFQEAEFGWQTWSGGALFAHLISVGKIKVDKERILELGCGTGIVGMMTIKQGAKEVVMTDYLPPILKNTEHNLNLNDCQSRATINTLDWTWIAENAPVPPPSELAYPALDSNDKFDVIFGADVCYDPIHGKLVPPVCAQFLSLNLNAKVYFVTGLRQDKFSRDISYFEDRMLELGFKLDTSDDITLDAFLDSAVPGPDRLGEKRRRGLARLIFKSSDTVFRFYTYSRSDTKGK